MGYDPARVGQFKPVEAAIKALGLPLIRSRKLNGILNALTTQIEDGGDSPAVNNLLLDALRAAIRHQVGQREGAAALEAIDAFEHAEAERWALVRAGHTPPRVLTPGERIDELVFEGRDLLEAHRTTAACDRWLEAWEIVKGLTRPGLRTVEALDRACGRAHHPTSDWAVELSFELWNAGLENPIYHEHRVRLVREFLALFPDSESDVVVNLMRGEGESLWALGRRQEAEVVYAALVERLPDEGWAYIGWADQYYEFEDRPKEYEKAEAILRRALERPGLKDRGDVLDRLVNLCREWAQPEKQAAVAAQRREERESRPWPQRMLASLQAGPDTKAAPLVKPNRNEPCWCGSGKKYKHCHGKLS
jgi:tetratricopeptide (TPR) repeat protein